MNWIWFSPQWKSPWSRWRLYPLSTQVTRIVNTKTRGLWNFSHFLKNALNTLFFVLLPVLTGSDGRSNAPQKRPAKMQNLISWWTHMVMYEKIEQKLKFPIFAKKNGAKKPCFGGYFLSKQEVTGSWSWWSFAAFKTTTDECHNTSISWKLPSKRWIFHWKKCPIFVDSVFNKIWPRPAEWAFLASVASLWWQMREPAAKLIWGPCPFFEAENRSEKSSSGPGGSKKGRIQNFFCLIL